MSTNINTNAEERKVLSFLFDDSTDTTEGQLSAMLTLLECNTVLSYCDDNYIQKLEQSCEDEEPQLKIIADSKNYKKGESINSTISKLDSTLQKASIYLGSVPVYIKSKMISSEYITNKFTLLFHYVQIAKQYKKIDTYGIPFETERARIDGLISMCERLVEMAKSDNIEAFASDQVWDSIATTSNGVFRTTTPKRGAVFREFSWVPPYKESFNFFKSPWSHKQHIQELEDSILKLRHMVLNDVVNAANYLKNRCKSLQSEVEHTRNDNYKTMTITYKRIYVIMKFLRSLQLAVLKEISLFCSNGINDFKRAFKKVETEYSKKNTSDKSTKQYKTKTTQTDKDNK